MFERMSLITIFTYIIFQSNIIKSFVKDKYDKKDKIIIIIFFSFLSIMGTYFRIYITNKSIANSRPLGTIVAGYLGGPLIGIIVGSISGFHRYTLGGFTAFACAISTVVEGAIGGLFRKLFNSKGINPFVAFLSSIVAEICQMIIILLFSNDFTEALKLVKTISLSMIITNSFGVFLMVMVIQSSKKLVDGQVKLVKLEQLNKISELKTLKAQIEPHFLFNSLNVISSYCRTDSERARQLILELSNYFRSTLEVEGDFSTLNKELMAIKAYLNIEQARFGNRLLINYSIDTNLLNCKFPILTIQPLIENSIKHGLLKKLNGGTLDILIKDLSPNIYIEINDDGVGFNHSDTSLSTGLGLKNINDRLKLLYGSSYSLNINSSEKGTSINFSIPKEAIIE